MKKVGPMDAVNDPRSTSLSPNFNGSRLMPPELIGENAFAIGIKVCMTSVIFVDLPNQNYKAKVMVMFRYRAQPANEGYSDTIEYRGKSYRKMQLPITNMLSSDTISEVVEIVSEEHHALQSEIAAEATEESRCCDLPLIQVLQNISATFRMSASTTVADFPLDAHNLIVTIIVMPSQPMAEDYFFAEIRDGFIGNMAILSNVEPISVVWAVYAAQMTQFKTPEKKVFFQFGFVIQRKFAPQFWNSFFIVFCLVAAGFTSFGLALVDLATRLTLFITIALTITAIKLSWSGVVPSSEKPNLIDTYANAAVAFELFSMLAASIAYSPSMTLINTDKAEVVFGVISVLIWSFYTAWFAVYAWKRHRAISNRISRPRVSEEPWVDVKWHGD